MRHLLVSRCSCFFGVSRQAADASAFIVRPSASLCASITVVFAGASYALHHIFPSQQVFHRRPLHYSMQQQHQQRRQQSSSAPA